MGMFDYRAAFGRNIGWVTEWEQDSLRGARAAIAGMGGVGGLHLLALARLGVGRFSLADFDTFGIENTNRQAGSFASTAGRPKLEVMAEQARDVNPGVGLSLFPEGVTEGNLDAFLDGAGVFVDGLDFFADRIRSAVFARCAELGIPALTAAPIGMGVGFLAFMPGGMTFEEYFRLEGQPEEERHLRFLMGLAPRGLHRSYLVDASRLDLAARKGPSTAAACHLCAGVTATAALKVLLNRGGVRAAPEHHHYDPYVGRLAVTVLPRGNDTPSQRRRLAAARAEMGRMRPARAAEAPPGTPAEAALEEARWAPSGDNSQPWRFALDGPEGLTAEVGPPDAGNPYEYRGNEPALLAGGMMLESMRIAAASMGRGLEWDASASPGGGCRVAARLPEDASAAPDPLAPWVRSRSVDRRAYSSRPLTEAEKAALGAAAAPDLRVEWHESRSARLHMADLGAMATGVRLRSEGAHAAHARAIDWRPGHSAAGMPGTSLGLGRAMRAAMRWAMGDWRRARAMNALAGTGAAAVRLDVVPALRSAAFFVMLAPPVPDGPGRAGDLLRRGMAVQRFWLTAARLGLAVQPALATLIFAQRGADGDAFDPDPRVLARAARLATSFEAFVASPPSGVAFMGRIGQPLPSMPKERSVRLSRAELMGRRGGAAAAGEAGTAPARASATGVAGDPTEAGEAGGEA